MSIPTILNKLLIVAFTTTFLYIHSVNAMYPYSDHVGNDSHEVSRADMLSNESELHLACQHGNLQNVKTIIQLAQDRGIAQKLLCQEDYLGQTALHIAAAFGHLEIAQELVKIAEELWVAAEVISADGFFGRDPLFCAVVNNHKTLITFLETAQKKYGLV